MTVWQKDNRLIHVGYSTNVHRTLDLADLDPFLDRHIVPVRQCLFPTGGQLGLDLHLGSAHARRLDTEPTTLEALRAALEERQLHVLGVNAFPLGDFQAEVVKAAVYGPDWTEPARRLDTLAIGRILARLLPEGAEGAVSTVAGGYRPAGHDPARRGVMAEAMVDVAAEFARLREETGRTVTLAPEPEPDTTLQDVASTVSFYHDHVRPAARQRLGALADEVIHRHLPVCLDACHLAVAFEDPSATVQALEAAGIRIGKAHVSCCPAVARPETNAAGRGFLVDLHEPRFLHQTWGAGSDRQVRLRLPDLDAFAALGPDDLKDIEEIRSHFHLPLGEPREGAAFTTTACETVRFLEAVLARTDCPALAVETYTWPVLDRAAVGQPRDRDLASGLAAELEWVFGRMKALGWGMRVEG
jgi:sugar phosphate isomerase/epimerase